MIAATADNVVGTNFATTLGLSEDTDECIRTVEHLMAALYGLQIDNVHCHVEGPEIPMLDGCASQFVSIFKRNGINALDKPKKFLRIVESVCCTDGDAWVLLKPHDSFRLSVQIDYEHSSFNDPLFCHASFDHAEQCFEEEISRARTYGFRSDYEFFSSMGLARGVVEGSNNVVIFNGEKLPVETKLRYPNEAARHKVLDAYGDLALSGYSGILGSYTGYKAGHTLNNRVLREVLNKPSHFEVC